MDIFKSFANFIKDSPEKFVATTLYSALGFYIISQNIKNRNKTQDRLKDASLSFPQFAKRKHITNDEATQRSKIISHVKYSLTLNLQKGSTKSNLNENSRQQI